MTKCPSDEEYSYSGEDCPICGYCPTLGEKLEFVWNTALQDRYCPECGATWVAEYKVTGYEELVDPALEEDDETTD